MLRHRKTSQQNASTQSVADGVTRRVTIGLFRFDIHDIRRSHSEGRRAYVTTAGRCLPVRQVPVRQVSSEFFIFQQDSFPARSLFLSC